MKTSEWVSSGHPDKLADIVSEYILDRLMERDPAVRYALEVQIKDEFVTLSGEITTTYAYTQDDLRKWVKEAIRLVGYTREYSLAWGAGNALNAEEVVVEAHISRQSPDISQGVDAQGWGDQGIFWGMCVDSPNTEDMPADCFMARAIGVSLYKDERCGLDVKTQVTMGNDGRILQVVAAAPLLDRKLSGQLEDMIAAKCRKYRYGTPEDIIINGTGAYVRHSTMGDCGTTGRKLVVDFYGGNCEIGGGSPWSKDNTKADLTLNAYARHLAREYMASTFTRYSVVKCRISCCIGRQEIFVTFLDGFNNELAETILVKSPRDTALQMMLTTPCMTNMCMIGLPYFV